MSDSTSVGVPPTDAMFNQNSSDDYGPVVTKWIADNQEWVDALTA